MQVQRILSSKLHQGFAIPCGSRKVPAMEACSQAPNAGIDREIPYRMGFPFQLNVEKPPKGTFQIDPVGTAYCMHDTATIMEERLICNMMNPAMIFRERCNDICDWRNTNNCTLLMLNREPMNLIRNPAMRLRRWISRGIQTGKGSHRTLRKAQM